MKVKKLGQGQYNVIRTNIYISRSERHNEWILCVGDNAYDAVSNGWIDTFTTKKSAILYATDTDHMVTNGAVYQ